MTQTRYRVLFLCTGNSARSILAEAVLNRLGQDRFRAYSAGSVPNGAVHPLALELLAARGYATHELRSKSWDEFSGPGALPIDFVFTVCDNAAKETCPVWLGSPLTAHWGIPDPAAAQGTEAERRRAFSDTLGRLTRRIEAFVSLPIEALDPATLSAQLAVIGRMQ